MRLLVSVIATSLMIAIMSNGLFVVTEVIGSSPAIPERNDFSHTITGATVNRGNAGWDDVNKFFWAYNGNEKGSNQGEVLASINGVSMDATRPYVVKTTIDLSSPGTRDGRIGIILAGDNLQNFTVLWYWFATQTFNIGEYQNAVHTNWIGSGVNYSQLLGTSNDIAILRDGNKITVWAGNTVIYDGQTIPTYTGSIIGFECASWGTGAAIFRNNIIYYTDSAILPPVKPINNKDYTDDISGLWYPYTTDGVFDSGTDTMTIYNSNGVGRFRGITMDPGREYIYSLNARIPVTNGQLRLAIKGDDHLNFLGLYISETSMSIYNIVGGIESSNLGTVNLSRPVNTDFEIIAVASVEKVSVWIDGKLYFDDVAVPVYTGTCMGAYGEGFSAGTVVTLSDFDIYYFEREILTKPANNRDYSDDISGLWYPYTTDGVFDPATDSITINNFNGIGKLTGLTLDNSKEYAICLNAKIPDTSGQLRLAIKGDDWQNFLGLYISGTDMSLYNLENNIELSNLGTVEISRPINRNFEIIVATSAGKVSVWIDGELYFNDVSIPTYSGTCIGMYGYEISAGSVITVSDIDIYYTEREALAKPARTKDYADDISGLWYPYTTDGKFDPVADIMTITNFNGIGKFTGLTMDASQEYAYSLNAKMPSASGQLRLAVKGDDWQNFLGIYISGTSMNIYNIVGGIEANNLGSVNFTRPINTDFEIVIATSAEKISVWIDGKLYFNDVSVPAYTGTCIGAYGEGLSTGSVIKLSDIDIFYTWRQEEFLISAYATWYHMNNTNPQLYFQNLKDANINLTLLVQQQSPAELISKVEACKQVQMKCLAMNDSVIQNSDNILIQESQIISFVNAVSDNKYLYGYYTWDEPATESFPTVKATNRLFAKYDATRPAYNCLIPSYGPYKWVQSNDIDYDEHVDSYIAEVNPQILSSDYYPFSEFGTYVNLSNAEIWKDMGYLRQQSIQSNIPYWHVFQGISDYNYGYIGYMTPDRIKVQMNYAMAYGVKSVSYFIASDIILDADGTPSPYYNEIKQINKEVLNVGNLLFDSTCTEIYHGGVTDSFSDSNYLNKLSDSLILSSLPNDTIAGLFRDINGETYIAISNKNYLFARSGTISLKNNYRIDSFNANTGIMTPVSNSANSISVSLGAGCIQVFKIENLIPPISFGGYIVSNSKVVTNILPKTTVEAFKNNLNIRSGTDIIFNKPNNEFIGTDTKFNVTDGKNVVTYTAVVYGDLDNDGDITIIDLADIKQHILKISILDSSNLKSGSAFKHQDTVSISDLLSVKKHLLGILNISQN